jgi:hypothetical protein
VPLERPPLAAADAARAATYAQTAASRSLVVSGSCYPITSAPYCGTYISWFRTKPRTCIVCNCAPGYYSPSGFALSSGSCSSCPGGQYQPSAGKTSCYSCPGVRFF